MAGSEEAIRPGSLRAIDRIFLVIHAVVSKDLSLRGIGGRDVRPAVDDALRLIEVHSFGDVVWDDRIVLPDFGDAIHLHSEQDRHAFAPQITGQQDRSGCSPAVAEENDAGSSSFFRGKHAVVIGVQQSNDVVVSLLSSAVFENPDVGVFGNGSLNLPRELDGAVVRVVMADETTHETDHDVGRSGSRVGRERCGVQRSRERWQIRA